LNKLKIDLQLGWTLGKCFLVVRKILTKKQQTYEAKPNLGKNLVIDFRTLKNQD